MNILQDCKEQRFFNQLEEDGLITGFDLLDLVQLWNKWHVEELPGAKQRFLTALQGSGYTMRDVIKGARG